jgi:hypothetical protein
MQKFKKRQPSILYQRLEEAWQQGRELRVKVSHGSFFSGIPVHLDSEFVELLSLHVSEEEDNLEEEAFYRTVWLIKLAEIVALSYPTELWSKERFNELINQSEIASEPEK